MTTARPVFWCQLANGPLMARKVNNCIVEIEVQTWIMSLTCIDKMRAGDGNRTRMASLEGWGSTIELRPRGGGGSSRIRLGRHRVAYRVGGGVTAQRSPPRYGRGLGHRVCRPVARRSAPRLNVGPPRLMYLRRCVSRYSGLPRSRRVCVGGRPAPRARGNRWASASPSPRISLADPLGRGRSGTNALRPDTPARRAPHRRLSGRDTAGQRPPRAACGPLRRNCPRWDKPSQGNSRCTRTWSRAVVDARRGEPMANPWPGASINAKPPPMQKPITPILPVQSSRCASQVRTTSTSSKVLALAISHVAHYGAQARDSPAQRNRSGAAARYPSSASQLAWFRRCVGISP